MFRAKRLRLTLRARGHASVEEGCRSAVSPLRVSPTSLFPPIRSAGLRLASSAAILIELSAQSVHDGVLLVARRIRRYCERHPEGVTTRTLRDDTKGPHGGTATCS